MKTWSILLNGYVFAVIAFVMIPIFIIFPMAFSDTSYLTFPPVGFSLRWFRELLTDGRWMAAAGFSFQIAVLVALTTSILGTMAAYAMVRGGGRFAAFFQTVLILPIIVPHIALAVALYLILQKNGLVGTIWAYVLAHSVIAMPFVVFTISAALSKVDATLEKAAMSCGASRITAFRLVTLPNIIPGILSGALFAFIISFDEPTITYFLAGIRDKTLPRLMFEDIQMNITPILAAVAVFLTMLSIVILLATAVIRSLSQRQISEAKK